MNIKCHGQQTYSKIDFNTIVVEYKDCGNSQYFMNGKKLNGYYKIDNKTVKILASFKDGVFCGDIINYHYNKKWTKESYGKNGERLYYTFYGNKKARKNDDFYKIQKYDSIKTVFKNNYPTGTFFYNNGYSKRIQYIFSPQNLEIISDVENFKLFSSNVIGFSIPMEFFFNKCSENILTYNLSSKNFDPNVIVKIRYKDSIKEQNFSLLESLGHMEYLDDKGY
jgi:hypothetical protein